MKLEASFWITSPFGPEIYFSHLLWAMLIKFATHTYVHAHILIYIARERIKHFTLFPLEGEKKR